MDFSLLLNVGCFAYIAYLLVKRAKTRTAPQVALPVQAQPIAHPRLDIEGTTSVPIGQRSFVRGFGIRQEQLIDLTFYAAPGNIKSFPEPVGYCLSKQYREGLAYGVETMQLVCLDGALEVGQALYFALVSTGQDSMPVIVAFVDKLRHLPVPVKP